jgi:protoporphyrinogen oxidase
MKKIAIVGGGFLGMMVAYNLGKNNIANKYQITLIEKSTDLGGLATCTKINGSYLERYYHHFFRSDTDIRDLFEELGLSDKLNWIEANQGFFSNGQLYDFSTSIDLLKFKPLSFISRIRAGLIAFYLMRVKSAKKFEKVAAIKWCNKYYGKEATNVLWKPLLLAKFGSKYYEKVSMAWLWARVHDRSSSRKSLLGKEELGYPEGSFKIILDELINRLNKFGVEILTGVTELEYSMNLEKHIINGKEYDEVVVTANTEFFIKKFKPNKNYTEKLSAINYLGATCMILVLDRPFGKYYWTSITDENAPILAVIEHTNFVSKDLFEGKSILYLGKYLETDNILYNMSENEVFDLYCEYLKKINPEFNKSWVLDKSYVKGQYAQHVVPVGYEVPPYETGTKGLYFANFCQIYPHDRGTNYAIGQAKEIYNLLK